jgi:hypothetical protein
MTSLLGQLLRKKKEEEATRERGCIRTGAGWSRPAKAACVNHNGMYVLPYDCPASMAPALSPNLRCEFSYMYLSARRACTLW